MLMPTPPELLQATADSDPAETQEWRDALDTLVAAAGPERARFILDRLVEHVRATGIAPTLQRDGIAAMLGELAFA